MKEIGKYVGYYLGVYVVVLAICGFFQYFYYCQGHSLMCAVNINRINTIITTTAYVLTPIVAIIGFANWREQNRHNKIQDIVIGLYKRIVNLRTNIMRLKIDKNLVNLEKHQHLDFFDFKNKISNLRNEYKSRIDNLRNDYDRINNELLLLDYYSNNQIKDEFEHILDSYFKLIERLDTAYLEYTEFHLKFKELQIPYLNDYLYKVCRCQIALINNSKLTSGDGSSPLLGSFEWLIEIKDKSDAALKKLDTFK